MTGPKAAELAAFRKRCGLRMEKVWSQAPPMGDFAVVYRDASDIGKVFQHFMASEEPFDQWFRDDILVEVHGMDLAAKFPPMNEVVLDFKG